MERTTRTRVCVWIIFIGLINFALFTVLAFRIGGDARYGSIKQRVGPEGPQRVYYVRMGSSEREVPGWVWIYSWVHSISIWVTQAAVLIAMLTLAKDRIVPHMEDGIISGKSFISIFATLVIVLTSASMIWFVAEFVIELSRPIGQLPLDAMGAATRPAVGLGA